MFRPVVLKNKEAVGIYNGLKLIQSGEVDKKTEDGKTVIEVISLPAKTAHRISRQLRKLEGIVEDYNASIKKFQDEVNEYVKSEEYENLPDEEKKFPRELFIQKIEDFDNETEEFQILEKPLKYSDNKEKSDFGKVELKSAVFELIPDVLLDYVE